ncbi:hypothetical protein GJAV_G00232170 [Gymnothorax javanicus]|nr:hypothetical protein GJAV_G00232170 [Gymnothorax javanicus]
MELKVWVDGVVRVVCGLSEETSCQDVVIALAQAIGQTGRYVLIQRLRDTERQLLATERPLEALAKLGQLGGELAEPEPPKRREPKKSLTFNLGPSSSPKSKLQHFKKPPSQAHRDLPEHWASPIPNATGAAGPSKEEVFRKVLQQQERLQALGSQLEGLQQEMREWEEPVRGGGAQEEAEHLEEVLQRNEAELALEGALQRELQAESEAERSLRRRLGDLHAKLDDCSRRLQDFTSRSTQLERQIQQEGRRTAQPPTPNPATDEQLDSVRAELQSADHQREELEASVTEMERALGQAEALLQSKNEELDELNKELRQCNLQQFIQQTGAPPSQSQLSAVLTGRSHSREDLSSETHTDIYVQPEQLDGYSNGGSLSYPAESPPRPTAKQFMGNPRNLQNPLVSSLNPEVLTSRESSWR